MNTRTPSVETILAEAVEIADQSQRQAFIEKSCAGDAALQARVERLVADHYRAGSFLERPAANLGATDEFTPSARVMEGDAARPAEGPGTVIGPYKLLEQIGEGGMGLVYLAEQQYPVKRRVALKIIKPGMDSRQVVARFEAERQALAMMDHPHIARIYDGGIVGEARDTGRGARGTDDAILAPRPSSLAPASGRPYFVMELVRGTPITEYCDQHRLTTRQRLHLFLDVCQAVQHAHQKGIIHRDLKPSNVLVSHHDVTPVVKVIDFGIAKATGGQLTDSTVYTAFAQMIGTPLYMSPEQAGLSDLDVDTRSDVYSLGVLLYELLTGTTPFDSETLKKAGYDEMRRIIREKDPPRPSARLSTMHQANLSTIAEQRGVEPRRLSRHVRGELDWIVMKALEKDRNRRYESASALAADLQRFSNDLPVLASPPSAVYRLRKFSRRNKTVVVSTVLVGLAILLGSGLSLWKYLDERAARRDADIQRKLAVESAAAAELASGAAVRARQDAERQRNTVYQNLYYADIRLSLVDWKAGNLARLSQKLLSHVPQASRDDLRSWEWYYLLSLCHQDERTLSIDDLGQYMMDVTSVAWSPDGRYLATTSFDGTAQVRDTRSWQLLRTFEGRTLERAASWSPDGQWLAWGAAADDSFIYLWRVSTDEVKTLRGHTSSVWTLAWAPDGKRLASAGIDHTIRIWEPATGSCLRVFEGIRWNISSVAWHPDGILLASAGGEGLTLWDTVAGNVARRDVYTKPAGCVAWSPDGKQCALGTSAGKCLLYRTVDWSLAAAWDGHSSPVNCVAWNPDGSRLATAGADNLIKLWEPTGGTCVQTLIGHRNPVLSVAWEPGGRRLASAGSDGTVKIWPVPLAPQPRRLIGRPGGVQAIAWCEERDALRSLDATNGVITLWNVVTGQCKGQTPVAHGSCGQFSSGGGLVAIATTGEEPPRLLISDARSGKPVQTVKAKVPLAALFSPDASKLAVDDGKTVELVDLRQNEVCFRLPERNGWNQVAWSPDGRLLAIAGHGEPSDDGTQGYAAWVYVFDTVKRQRIWKLQHGSSRVSATAVTWSPNGRQWVSGDVNGLAEVREVSTGHKVVSAQLHTAEIKALAWSPDGRRIASSSVDRTVRVWDSASGEELLRFDIPETAVQLLQWSPDGYRLAGACMDGTIQVWDASAGYQFVRSEAYYAEEAATQLRQATELWNLGRQDDAIALHEHTLAKYKATLGSEHRVTLGIMHNLAECHWKAGRLPEAIALFEPTVEQRKAALGPDHRDTLKSMVNLAVCYWKAGRRAEAIGLMKLTLEILEAKRGLDHPATLTTVDNLMHAYTNAGRLPEAIALLELTLEKRKAKLGLDHPATLWSMVNLAIVYRTAGRPQEAIPMLEETFNRAQKLKADSEIRPVMAAVAEIYEQAGQLVRAERIWQKSLDRSRTELGAEDSDLASGLAQLGLNLLKQQKWAEAEPLLRECLAIRERKTPDDWKTANAKALLGGALLGQKKYVEAEPLLLEGYKGMKQGESQIPSLGKIRLTEAAERLARFYDVTNQPEKAAAWRRELEGTGRP